MIGGQGTLEGLDLGAVHGARPWPGRWNGRAALRSALSVKAAENSLVFLDELKLADAKTRLMSDVLGRLVGDSSVLILVPEKNLDYDTVIRSTNNLPDAKTLLANYLNIRDVLGYEKVLIPIKALDVLVSYLG